MFVGEAEGEVLAWAALAPFSHREWYAGVAEYTVYVAGRAQGAGLGRRMLAHLVGEAPAHGYWKLVGLIFPENAAGLALARGAGLPRGGDAPRPRAAAGASGGTSRWWSATSSRPPGDPRAASDHQTPRGPTSAPGRAATIGGSTPDER